MKNMFLNFCGLLLAINSIAFVQKLQGQEQELPRLAVVKFTSNVNTEKTKADGLTVRNLVESQMVAVRKYQIITRSEIDQLLNNQRIQVSSISSAENIKKLQLQNISYIVTGSVDAMGSDYAVTVKILDVSTGQFSHSANEFMGGASRELYNGVNTLVANFVKGMSATGGQVAQANYNVGDFGPAGGRIFYDKGVYSNGWRYLEAAPSETEFTAQWGGAYEGSGVSGTGTAIGTGKRNTQLIVEYLRRISESGRAAQRCDSLVMDSYNDWLLPSKDELNLMYQNLKRRELGEFSPDSLYWSSSEFESDSELVGAQGFGDGTQYGNYKVNTHSVRAVRAF
jgi:TolB-like protein